MNLYTLTEEFRKKAEEIEEMLFLGEVEQEVFNDTLDSLKAPLEEKVENIVKYMKSLEALAEAKKTEAKRLQESAASDLKKVEWFKQYVHDNLTKANIKELQAGVFKVAFRKGSEVVQINEESLPQTYKVATWKPMAKTELKKLIQLGAEIPGVQIIRNPDSLVVK